MGAVGLPVWMWTQQMPPQSVTVTIRGFSMTATARLQGTSWKMGDGNIISCDGPRATGTPYTDAAGISESPTCGHRYTKQGRYQVTVQARWVVTWTGGATGTDQLAQTAGAPLTIGEYQSVTR